MIHYSQEEVHYLIRDIKSTTEWNRVYNYIQANKKAYTDNQILHFNELLSIHKIK